MKKKIVILGATGFIGTNLLHHFANSGEYEVFATYNRVPFFEVMNVTWKRADLLSKTDVDNAIAEMDIVIQAAATTSGAIDIVNSPYMHVTDNAIMNSLILRSCFENSIKHFIFPSCTVMYQPSEKAIKESDFSADQELLPNYFGVGNTKLYIEKMCEFYGRISDIRFTVIMHSNIYGPHDKFDLKRSHVFGATVSKVMTAEKKVMVWGDGSEKRDLLYVDDLCSFVDMSIINQKSQFEVFNCGLGEAVSIRELVERIIIHSGKNPSLFQDSSPN